MRVLITGGTGFVGINLAKRLVALGDDVVVTYRSTVDELTRRYVAGTSIRFARVDVTDQQELRGLFVEAKPEVVVHAAVKTVLDVAGERKLAGSIVEVNVVGTVNVMGAAVEAGARRAIYISSSGVFPAGSITDPPIPENGRPAPTSLYGITKYASEMIWGRLSGVHGLAGAAVRIAQPFGPMERQTGTRPITSPIHEWMLNARAGEVLRIPTWPAGKDWMYIADTANGLATLVHALMLGYDTYHLGPARVWRVEDVVAALRELYPSLHVEMDGDASNANPNISASGLRGPLASDRMRDEFGFEPRYTLAAALRDYSAWLDRQMSVPTSPRTSASADA